MKKLFIAMCALFVFLLPMSAEASIIGPDMYFYMRRTHLYLYGKNDLYESAGVIVYGLKEDAGWGDDDDVKYESSNKKVLDFSKGAGGDMFPGDTKVTLISKKGEKVYTVHLYSFEINPVLKSTKVIKLKTEGNLKGCTAVIKIGKKVYKKKITKANQILRFKIKKSSAGKRLVVKILKGKNVLFNCVDRTYSRKKICKGLSKKEAKKTWEYRFLNSFKIKKSGKYEYWDNGSTKVTLKNNKVQKVMRKKW